MHYVSKTALHVWGRFQLVSRVWAIKHVVMVLAVLRALKCLHADSKYTHCDSKLMTLLQQGNYVSGQLYSACALTL